MSAAVPLVDVRYHVDRMLHRDELRASGRSATGAQLDIMRNACPEIDRAPRSTERVGYLWARKNRADELDAEFAFYVGLAARLSAEEYAVLESYHTPLTLEEQWARITPQQLAEGANPGEYGIRSVWESDLVNETQPDGTIHQRTRAGEEIEYWCRGETCEHPKCTHEPGKVLVKGPPRLFPRQEEVAQRMGLTVHVVRHLVKSAYRTIRDALEERALREGAE